MTCKIRDSTTFFLLVFSSVCSLWFHLIFTKFFKYSPKKKESSNGRFLFQHFRSSIPTSFQTIGMCPLPTFMFPKTKLIYLNRNVSFLFIFYIYFFYFLSSLMGKSLFVAKYFFVCFFLFVCMVFGGFSCTQSLRWCAGAGGISWWFAWRQPQKVN